MSIGKIAVRYTIINRWMKVGDKHRCCQTAPPPDVHKTWALDTRGQHTVPRCPRMTVSHCFAPFHGWHSGREATSMMNQEPVSTCWIYEGSLFRTNEFIDETTDLERQRVRYSSGSRDQSGNAGCQMHTGSYVSRGIWFRAYDGTLQQHTI